MSAHGKFIWYELMTRDPQAASTFYHAVVGWRIAPVPDPTASEVDYRLIGRDDGGTAGGALTLTAAMEAGGARPTWLGYLCVDDVDAVLAAMHDDGATVLMPPMDLPVGRIALLSDPQGAAFYVMRPIPPAGADTAASDVFSHDRPGHVRWNELATSDPAAAVAFYTRHFGWAQPGAMEMGELGQYRFLEREGQMLGAVMPNTPTQPDPAWLFYIGVPDIDRAVAAVTRQGGTLCQAPLEIPGGEFAALARDPQGAAFGLVGPRRT
ncbi:MAG: VOC family protein [Gammaproteobacteria bacterium]